MSVAGLDELALSYVVRFGDEGFREMLQHGISPDHFDQDFRMAWGYIMRSHREHGEIPSSDALERRYPTLDIVKVKRTDMTGIVHDMKMRYKYVQFLTAATDAAARLGDGWDKIDDVLEETIGHYNTLLYDNGNSQRLIDLFSEKAEKQILEEMKERKEQKGIPTGIAELDRKLGGGWRPKRMVVSIGRTSAGKSWLNLLHAATAVLHGKKVVLFSLEMTVYEVAMRLYTILSFILSPKDPLVNMDLEHGKVTERKLKRFMAILRERFDGLLYIGDSTFDAYTLERIQAEVEGIRPDMFWVDYLTLVRSRGEGWEGVKELSRGIKLIANRTNSVGGCSAQANRKAMDGESLLPKLHHIAYGDSIAQDANHVISMAKRKTKTDMQILYWQMIKNRHGTEGRRHKMRFDPNIGLFEAMKDEDDD